MQDRAGAGTRNEKMETKESSALVSRSILAAKVLQSSMTELSEWLEIEPVKSCVPSGPYEWEWIMLLYSTAAIYLSTTYSTTYTEWMLTEKEFVKEADYL